MAHRCPLRNWYWCTKREKQSAWNIKFIHNWRNESDRISLKNSQIKTFFLQNLKIVKNTAEKKIIIFRKLQFIYTLAFLKDVLAIGESTALKKEHPALKKMKFINFFLFLG